jgi:hypothetical protein
MWNASLTARRSTDAEASPKPQVWARRRRGVQRGRRILARAIREFLKRQRTSNLTMAGLVSYANGDQSDLKKVRGTEPCTYLRDRRERRYKTRADHLRWQFA